MARRTLRFSIALVTTLYNTSHATGFIAPLSTLTARANTKCRSPASVRMSATETQATQYTIDNKAIGGPLKPISNSILVRIRSKDVATDGGIILPDKAREKPTEGVVIAMGTGRTHLETGVPIPMPCDVGDKVLYGKYDGTGIKYNGEDHQFVRDENILFVYSGDKMTESTIKMIRDEILVKLDEERTTTKSGLLLGNKEEDTGTGPTTGEVVAVGPGRTSSSGDMVPMTIQKGDLVKFRNFAGSEVSFQGTQYRVMKSGDILAKW